MEIVKINFAQIWFQMSHYENLPCNSQKIFQMKHMKISFENVDILTFVKM